MTCTQTSLNLTQSVNVTNFTQNYTFQEGVTMSCNTGYSGKTVRARCTDINKWSQNSPTCTGKTLIFLNLYM